MSQIESETGPVTLREINCEARRRRILDAARRIIVSGGTSALSMRKLAKEADLSVTTLYNLFGAREDILVALIEDGIDGMDGVLEREAPLADPFERCRAVITVSTRHIAENEEIYRPMMVASYDRLSLDVERDHSIAERAAGMQAVAITAAIEQGLLLDTLDPAQLGRQIYHGYELALVQWAHGLLDEAGFRARALYGLYVALLAVATDKTRPRLQAEVRKVESELGATRRGRKPSPGPKRRSA